MLFRDLKALLSRHQQSDVPLTWGDVVAGLGLHTPSPQRERALELVETWYARRLKSSAGLKRSE